MIGLLEKDKQWTIYDYTPKEYKRDTKVGRKSTIHCIGWYYIPVDKDGKLHYSSAIPRWMFDGMSPPLNKSGLVIETKVNVFNLKSEI